MTDEEKAAADKAARAAEFKAMFATALKESLAPAVAELVKPLGESIKTLSENQKVLADTIKDAPPAKKSDDAAAADAKPLTAEEQKKLIAQTVADAIVADRKAQQTTAEQQQARDTFINGDASGLKKLPPEYRDRLGADSTKWADEAKQIVGSFEKFLKDNGVKIADVGGANREGGDAKGETEEKPRPTGISGLAEGTQKFANSIVIPSDAAPAAAAKPSTTAAA